MRCALRAVKRVIASLQIMKIFLDKNALGSHVVTDNPSIDFARLSTACDDSVCSDELQPSGVFVHCHAISLNASGRSSYSGSWKVFSELPESKHSQRYRQEVAVKVPPQLQ